MTKKEEYNNLPVFYCKNCLSLNIKLVENSEFCDSCGSTEIETTDIEEWEKLYKKRYNKYYLDN